MKQKINDYFKLLNEIEEYFGVSDIVLCDESNSLWEVHDDEIKTYNDRGNITNGYFLTNNLSQDEALIVKPEFTMALSENEWDGRIGIIFNNSKRNM